MTMKFLAKLAAIANELDAKGLYEEADILDSIVKEAQDFPPGWQSVHNFPEDTIVGRKPTTYNFTTGPDDTIMGQRNNPAMKRCVAGLDKLRKMFGLPPGNFDAALAKRLNILNRKYPGVWIPGSNQKLSEVMSNAKKALVSEFEYAQKAKKPSQVGGLSLAPTILPSGARDPGAQEFHPTNKELFPSTQTPSVQLKDKKEFKL
jgi:hypothetical protein